MGNREVEARYREAHKEQINERKRMWHAQNKERINAARRARYSSKDQSCRSTNAGMCCNSPIDFIHGYFKRSTKTTCCARFEKSESPGSIDVLQQAALRSYQ